MAACERLVADAASLDSSLYARARAAVSSPQPSPAHPSAASRVSSHGQSMPDSRNRTRPRRTPHACEWRPLCRRGHAPDATCKRNRTLDAAGRLAAAPTFSPGSGACYTGERALLSRAWVDHPMGGRVLAGRAFGRLVRVNTSSTVSRATGAG